MGRRENCPAEHWCFCTSWSTAGGLEKGLQGLPARPPSSPAASPFVGLQESMSTRSKHLSTAAKHGCAMWPGMSLAWLTERQWELYLVSYHFVVCILGGKHLASVHMAVLTGHQNVWVLQWGRTKKNLLFSPLLHIKWKEKKECSIHNYRE